MERTSRRIWTIPSRNRVWTTSLFPSAYHGIWRPSWGIFSGYSLLIPGTKILYTNHEKEIGEKARDFRSNLTQFPSWLSSFDAWSWLPRSSCGTKRITSRYSSDMTRLTLSKQRSSVSILTELKQKMERFAKSMQSFAQLASIPLEPSISLSSVEMESIWIRNGKKDQLLIIRLPSMDFPIFSLLPVRISPFPMGVWFSCSRRWLNTLPRQSRRFNGKGLRRWSSRRTQLMISGNMRIISSPKLSSPQKYTLAVVTFANI